MEWTKDKVKKMTQNRGIPQDYYIIKFLDHTKQNLKKGK